MSNKDFIESSKAMSPFIPKLKPRFCPFVKVVKGNKKTVAITTPALLARLGYVKGFYGGVLG
jgi:hypothetical protein